MLPELKTNAPATSPMSSATRRARKIAAKLAAALTLLFALVSTVGFYEHSLAAFTGRGYGLLAILLSLVAFALSLRIRSPAVAGMLVFGGILVQVPPVQAIMEAGVIAVPGPILGVISFVIILILGLIKAIGLRGPNVAAARAPNQSAAGHGTPMARSLANMLPDLFAFSPTSASTIIVYLLAFSTLYGSRDTASAQAEPILASRIRVVMA